MSAFTPLDLSRLLGTPGYIEAFVKAFSGTRVSARFAEANKEAAVAVR